MFRAFQDVILPWKLYLQSILAEGMTEKEDTAANLKFP